MLILEKVKEGGTVGGTTVGAQDGSGAEISSGTAGISASWKW